MTLQSTATTECYYIPFCVWWEMSVTWANKQKV